MQNLIVAISFDSASHALRLLSEQWEGISARLDRLESSVSERFDDDDYLALLTADGPPYDRRPEQYALAKYMRANDCSLDAAHNHFVRSQQDLANRWGVSRWQQLFLTTRIQLYGTAKYVRDGEQLIYLFMRHLESHIAQAFADNDAGKLRICFLVLDALFVDLDIGGAFKWDAIYDALNALAELEPVLLYLAPPPTLHKPQLIVEAQTSLIERLSRQPRALYEITPRQFEEVIAEVFARQGFHVELTRATRDGGRDVIAVHEIAGVRSKMIIECKRYAETNKVGLAIVQRLFGVRIAEAANKAILATTSTFTRDAVQFAQQHMWDLDLKAYEDVVGWIRTSRSGA